MDDKTINEIKRLQFEDFIWVVFIILGILNIFGNHNEIEYLKTNNNSYEDRANQLFLLTIIVTFFIYIYFFIRNYKAYENASENNKQLYSIKLLGSSFLIAGILCLLYFQTKQTSFIGSPGI